MMGITNNMTIEIAEWIIWYALSATLILIIMIIVRIKRRDKYMVWKKWKLHLGIIQGEWGRNEDTFLDELIADNERLEKENKYLRNLITKVSILGLVFIGIVALIAYASQIADYFKRLGDKKED